MITAWSSSYLRNRHRLPHKFPPPVSSHEVEKLVCVWLSGGGGEGTFDFIRWTDSREQAANGGGGRGLDVTSQLHGQHLPKPDGAIFNIIQRKMQQCFLAVVNFGHKEGITRRTSGSSQRLSSDKVFPHKESPPAHP